MSEAKRISLKNILLTTDFSPASEAALPYAVQVAKQFGAKVYIVHVVFPELYEALPPEAGRTAVVQARQLAEQKMDELVNSGKLADVPHEGIIRTGEIWDEIASVIAEAKIDLIVTGTRGRRGMKKTLLGSVAEEIFRLAPVPVLTVGPKAPSSVAPQLRSILHPTDFSLHSAQAAEYALGLAQEFQSCLTLLHVAQEPGADPLNRARLSDFFCERLAEVVPREASDWCQPQYRVEFGDPAERIIQVSRETGADLIVMGIWGAGALARATAHVGDTAYRVVSEAPAPVLTVRGASWERP